MLFRKMFDHDTSCISPFAINHSTSLSKKKGMHLLETINDSRRANSPKPTMFAKLSFHLFVSLLCLHVSPGLITHFLVTL